MGCNPNMHWRTVWHVVKAVRDALAHAVWPRGDCSWVPTHTDINKYEGSLQTFLPSDDCERTKCTKFLVFARRKLGTNGTIASQGMTIQGHLPQKSQTLYKNRQNYLREKESLWRPLVVLSTLHTCRVPTIVSSLRQDERSVPRAFLSVSDEFLFHTTTRLSDSQS